MRTAGLPRKEDPQREPIQNDFVSRLCVHGFVPRLRAQLIITHSRPQLLFYLHTYALLFTQFGHEGESDLIWACSLGMPFIYWPTADKEKPSPNAKNTLLPKATIAMDSMTFHPCRMDSPTRMSLQAEFTRCC